MTKDFMFFTYIIFTKITLIQNKEWYLIYKAWARDHLETMRLLLKVPSLNLLYM